MICICHLSILQPPKRGEHNVDCANGYTEACVVIVIDASHGCVLSVYGRDCSGAIQHEWNRDRIVPAPPLLPFTHHFEGFTDNGAPWYVNIDIENGNLTGPWGRKGSGDDFVSELADLL